MNATLAGMLDLKCDFEWQRRLSQLVVVAIVVVVVVVVVVTIVVALTMTWK